MEIQIFHHAKIYNLQKHPLKILQDIIITLLELNLKFQQKPKYHFSKIFHIKIDLLFIT
jgi:hypothetical protein